MKNLNFEKIKKLIVIAMFSDDDLMDIFVLKGGNALDNIHNISYRFSQDIDFSIENEFLESDFELIKVRIENSLKKTFYPEGYEVFDIKLIEKPVKLTPDMSKFWGGYQGTRKDLENQL